MLPAAISRDASPAERTLRDRLRQRVEAAQRRLEEERQRVARQGVSVVAALLDGRPWEAIVEDADRLGAGMLVIGHHDPQAIQRLRAAWQAGGKTLRVVGDKSAVVPLEERVCYDPDRLLAAVRTLLRPTRGRPYSPRPASIPARP